MKKEYIFKGKFAWVSNKSQTFKTAKGEETVWGLAFYPETAADRRALTATGIKNKAQEDDGSCLQEGLMYFRLRNKDEPYKIINDKGEPLTEMVGNGSSGMLKLVVENFNSKTFGPQARSWVTEVMITDLVPYNPLETAAPATPQADLPA